MTNKYGGYDIKVEKSTAKQRGGKSPDIQVTRTIFTPRPRIPMPDGITKEEFHNILKKASQPIKKPKSGREQS